MTGPADFAGSERARQLLTALQERAYATAGRRPNVYDGPFGAWAAGQMVAERLSDRPAEEQRQIRDQIVRMAAEDVRKAPSRYEDPLMYSIMVELAGYIEQAAGEVGMTVAHRPVLGSLPHGQVNALTILVPGTSEHIVLFESQMFLFALLLSKAVARTFPLTTKDGEWLGFSVDRGEIEARMDSDESVTGRFTEVVLAYAMTGRPGDAPQYFVEPPYATMAYHLRNSLELFVLGHEYGHVIGGHLAGATRTAALLPGEDTEALDYSWQQEHEADIYGALLATAAMRLSKRLDGPLSYWGSDLFFSAMEVMDRAVSLLRTGDEERQTLGSHPPADRRRAHLRRSMRQIFGDEAGGRLVGMGEVVEQVVAALWARARPAVLDARARGGEAARSWRG